MALTFSIPFHDRVGYSPIVATAIASGAIATRDATDSRLLTLTFTTSALLNSFVAAVTAAEDAYAENGPVTLVSDHQTLLTSTAQYQTVSALSQPYGVSTTYSIVGTAPATLGLLGNAIVGTGTAPVAGATYTIRIRAASADGLRACEESFDFVGKTSAALGPVSVGVAVGTAAGTTLATVTGLASDETLTSIVADDGVVKIDATRKLLVLGNGNSAQSVTYAVGTSYGRVLSITISVRAALNAITLASSTATVGALFVSPIAGNTSGSTLTATADTGEKVEFKPLLGLAKAAFKSNAVKSITITETLAGAPNSPKTSIVPVNATGTPVPLPSLPLPMGSKMVSLGDSLVGLGLTSNPINGTNYLNTRYSSLIDTAWSADPRFEWSNFGAINPSNSTNVWDGSNQSVPSDHMDWDSPVLFGDGILNRLDYALARKPAVLFLQGGGNSFNSGDDGTGPSTSDYVISVMDTIITRTVAAGVWVILMTTPASAYLPSGDPRHDLTRQYNVWARAQVGRTGVKVIDPYNDLLSTTDPDMPNMAYFQSDGVHLNQAGCQLIYVNYLKAVIQSMFAAGTVFSTDPTLNNLVPPAIALMQAGTGGGKLPAATTTGNVPSNWTIQAGRSVPTVACTIDTSNSAYSRLVMAATLAADASTQTLCEVTLSTPNITAGLPAAGTWVRFFMAVETPDLAFGTSWSSVELRFTWRNTAGTTFGPIRAQQEYSGLSGLPAQGRGQTWVVSAPFQWPTDCTAYGFSLILDAPKTQTGTVIAKVDRLMMRAVTDPRTTWSLPTS